MATYTTAQMKAAGINPASTDRVGTPGPIVIEYLLDGSKKAIVATDVVTFFDIPAGAGILIDGASWSVVSGATATAVGNVGIAGTPVTGLTAADLATVGGVIKLATAANSIVTGVASSLTTTIGTAALGNGVFRLRVYGTLYSV